MRLMYFFWGKDLLSEFSVISLLFSGIKSFFMLSNLLYLPALFLFACWIILLSRAQFRHWRIFYVLSGILLCAGFGFMIMFFLVGCCHVNRALSMLPSFTHWKSFAGLGILALSLILLAWNLLRLRNKGITGLLALLSTGLFGIAFGLSYVFLITDDLQYLMRTIVDRELIVEGLPLFFAYALGATLPVVLLLVPGLLFFSFSGKSQYPSVAFTAVAFLVIAMTGILTLTGHLGVYCPLFLATLVRG